MRELEEYREIERRIRDDKQSYFGYVTLRWGLAQSRAWIRWADEILGSSTGSAEIDSGRNGGCPC